jgi:hypothetical protein
LGGVKGVESNGRKKISFPYLGVEVEGNEIIILFGSLSKRK